MEYAFEITLKNRKILNSFLKSFSLEELNKVPKGFNNNIIWNIAHVVVVQQLLVYKLSRLPMITNDELVEKYKKGTKAEKDVTQNEVNQIKDLLFSTIKKTKEDYGNGIFKNYHSFTTATNSTINNAEEAIAFNNFHEGLHLGYILALKKSL